ncbi:MAG: XdhC family protein [Acidiferrobacterales bacterium]
METPDLEVLRNAVAWKEQGHDVIIVTVAATWGSSPRPAGSMLVLRADGRMAGSVSGGCVEEDLVQRLRQRAPADRLPEVVRYGVSAEDTRRFGLPCGGRLELVTEKPGSCEPLRSIVRAIDARMLIARRLCLATGEASLHAAGRGSDFSWDGRDMVKVFGPAWRLLVIGAGQISRYLAQMASALDYEVIVCDPRVEYRDTWPVNGVAVDASMPDDAVAALACDARSAVIALTHDPKLDDLALMEALGSAAFYVGALGSTANNARRRERLASLGLPPDAVARLHGPVGLRIGSRTPPEIAIAILAELTAVRRGSVPALPSAFDRAVGCVASIPEIAP